MQYQTINNIIRKRKNQNNQYVNKINNSNDTSSIDIIGTPSYIAPEIWHYKEYTEKADVYAFAMIMYELLTLNEPFKNFSVFTLYSKVIENEERPDFVFPIPVPYRELIMSCWANNPDDRPSFSDIVYRLRKESEFITDSIDKNEFFDYVDLLDTVHSSFNSDKKLKTIVLTNKNLEKDENFEDKQDDEIGKKINEKYEDEIKSDKNDKYDIITIEKFNKFTLEMQYQTINILIQQHFFFFFFFFLLLLLLQCIKEYFKLEFESVHTGMFSDTDIHRVSEKNSLSILSIKKIPMNDEYRYIRLGKPPINGLYQRFFF